MQDSSLSGCGCWASLEDVKHGLAELGLEVSRPGENESGAVGLVVGDEQLHCHLRNLSRNTDKTEKNKMGLGNATQ